MNDSIEEKLQLLSEFHDQPETVSSNAVDAVLENPAARVFHSNLNTVSSLLRDAYCEQEGYLENIDLTEKVTRELDRKEEELDLLLKGSLALPDHLENHDLWSDFKDNLDRERSPIDEGGGKDTDTEQSEQQYILDDDSLSELLQTGFAKPQDKIQDDEIWLGIQHKLDEVFHTEIHSETYQIADRREKFYVGMSEYIDHECSAKKSAVITDHLLACPDCRAYYVSLSRLKKALYYSHHRQDLSETCLWTDLEQRIFDEQDGSKDLKLKKA